MKIFGKNVPFSLLFLFFHGAVCVLATFNYSFWMRFQNNLVVGEIVRQAYLAFTIIGFTAYVLGAAPLFFYSYKYAASQKSGAVKLRLGIAIIYFLSSLPIFALELAIAYSNQKIVSVLDGIVLVLSLIAWAFGSLVVWFVYMWEVARFLQSQTGASRQVMFNPRYNPQGDVAPPYLTAVANRFHPGQPAVV
jgi:hypothetical protein